MKKLIFKVSDLAIYGYALFSIVVWVLNYLNIDVTAIMTSFGVDATFFGVTGFGVGAAKTVQVVLRWALNKFEMRNAALYSLFLQSMTKVLEVTSVVEQQEIANNAELLTVNKQLKSLTEFMLILAEKNTKSTILDDDLKDEIKAWILSQKQNEVI